MRSNSACSRWWIILCVGAPLCGVFMIPRATRQASTIRFKFMTRSSSMDSFQQVPSSITSDAMHGPTSLDSFSRSWGMFRRNESTLTETQVIHRPNWPPTFDMDSVDGSFDQLFIDPASSFAFCIIQKKCLYTMADRLAQ